jgi:hypothetical protein
VYVTLDNRDKVGLVTVHGKSVSYGLIHHSPRFLVTTLSGDGLPAAVSAEGLR